jgi:hypothetical protein
MELVKIMNKTAYLQTNAMIPLDHFYAQIILAQNHERNVQEENLVVMENLFAVMVNVEILVEITLLYHFVSQTNTNVQQESVSQLYHCALLQLYVPKDL